MDLRGASADALVALRDELDSAASTNTAAAEIAEDLFRVAATVRNEGALRRFLTDAAVPVEARQGLAGEVLGRQVGDGAAAVVTAAAGRRWTLSRDLADALEHLGVVAAVRSAGARADRLADELFAVGQLLKDNPELRDALADPVRSTDDKAGLVDTLFGDKVLPATTSLVRQALAGTYRTVSAALDAFEKVAADVHGESVATVRVARELPDADRERLAAALATQYGRPVHLNVVVDPSVLGGIRVEIGDDVIDGTVSSRLEEARRQLAG